MHTGAQTDKVYPSGALVQSQGGNLRLGADLGRVKGKEGWVVVLGYRLNELGLFQETQQAQRRVILGVTCMEKVLPHEVPHTSTGSGGVGENLWF